MKPDAYFPTYNDAYAALVEYNKNPYSLDPRITVKELYEKWTDEYFRDLKSDSSIRSVTSAWTYCSSTYDMRVIDIRARHIKVCMENGVTLVQGKERHPSAGTKGRITSLFNLMLDYALEYEIVDRNFARTFKISDDIINEKEDSRRGHMPYTDEEIQLLWGNVDKCVCVDVILIQCYSGWRPQELGLIEIENVDLENWTFKSGLKTEAGINRTVPIHPRIRPLVSKKYNEAKALGSKHLINSASKTNPKDIMLTYRKYQNQFTKVRDQLKLDPYHRPHDGRMHFIAAAKKYGVDEYAIKYMIGHSISDLTEKVHTKREFEWLQTEIEKIK